jgi:flagellin
MLDTEFQALTSEIDRIAKDTDFNGTSLVNGSSTTTTTIGATSIIDAAHGFASIKLGNDVGDAAISVNYDAATKVLTLKNLTSGESQGIAIGAAAIANNQTQTVNFDQIGAVVELNAAFNKSASIASLPTYLPGTADTGDIDIASVTASNISDAADFAAQTGNVVLDDTGNPATSTLTYGDYQSPASSVNLLTTGHKTVTLTNSDGDTFDLSFDVTVAFDGGGTIPELDLSGMFDARITGTASTSDTTDFTFKLGTGVTANVDEVTIGVGSVSTESLGIDGQNVLTKSAADTASTAISAAIDTLSKARANVGASQNRLDFASDNLSSTIENTEAARSSLLDLDVASEMTMFTAKQVLVQSGVAMLAQANQMPQNLLKLFQ